MPTDERTRTRAEAPDDAIDHAFQDTLNVHREKRQRLARASRSDAGAHGDNARAMTRTNDTASRRGLARAE